MFCGIGKKSGANLNSSKTRILTSMHGKGVTDQLLCSSCIGVQSVGASLQRAIKQYSADTDGQRNDGLRVLGVPICSKSFCQDFITAQVKKMEADSSKILAGLEPNCSFSRLAPLTK